jgi:hypothetical protein
MMLTGIMPMALEELIGMAIKQDQTVGLGESLKGVPIMDEMHGHRLIAEHQIMVGIRVFRRHDIDGRLSLAALTDKVGIMLL